MIFCKMCLEPMGLYVAILRISIILYSTRVSTLSWSRINKHIGYLIQLTYSMCELNRDVHDLSKFTLQQPDLR